MESQRRLSNVAFLQDLFRGDCVSRFQAPLPTDANDLDIAPKRETNLAWNKAQTNRVLQQQPEESNVSKKIEFVFSASTNSCNGSPIGQQASRRFRNLDGWCENCKTWTVLMEGPECPTLGEGFEIVRNNGNDEFGLAKEAKRFSAYPYLCEKMAQGWDSNLDQLVPTDGQRTLRRRLDSAPGSDKLLVVLQTESEEPVGNDSAEYLGSAENGESGTAWWVWFVIALLSVLCFILLVLLIWCCCNRDSNEPEAGKKKQISVYRSQSQKENWERIKKDEEQKKRARAERKSSRSSTPNSAASTDTGSKGTPRRSKSFDRLRSAEAYE